MYLTLVDLGRTNVMFLALENFSRQKRLSLTKEGPSRVCPNPTFDSTAGSFFAARPGL